MRVPWRWLSRRSWSSVLVGLLAVGALLTPLPVRNGVAAPIAASSAATGTQCGPGSPNASTNNVTDYRTDTNVVAGGRWSYQNLTNENSPQPLVKGGTGVFAADEWMVDPTKPDHAWYVKSDGSIGTDWRPIAFAYTAGVDQADKTLHVTGTWDSAGGRFRILQSHDGSTTSIAGPYTTLLTFNGTSTSFDLQVPVAAGDDLLFVSDQQTSWWVAGKLNATVTTTTNNVTDYHTDTNVVAGGRWSYQNLTNENSPQLLVKGGTGVFAADEWVVDPAKPEHAWYVKSDGSIGTDWRPIAFAYTPGADQAGRTLHAAGTWSSGGGRFRILQSHDGSTTSIAGPYTTLLTFNGTSTSFDLQVPVAAGDDLVFVSDQQTSWWVAGKLNATITTDDVPQTQPVVASPGAGAVVQGTQVALSDPTPGACISYTSDGSDPLTSATRMQYTAPITINADTHIKAVATVSGQPPSVVSDPNYFLARVQRFLGIDQGPTSSQVAGAQWGRMDIYWGAIEPVKGQINQAALDNYKNTIATAMSNGITMLPILDYTADWAANRTGYSFPFHGQTYTYGQVTSESNGNLTRNLTIKDSAGAVVSSQNVTVSASKTPPQNLADWQNYVQLVVSQLRPLGINYFQIWNEAYPGSGFWMGGMDQYMQLIHLPAAAIIHQAGGQVVYGAWPDIAPVSEFIALLDANSAWRSVDVYDVHYMPLPVMQTVYNAAYQRGIYNPAVWQTELGFTPLDEFIVDEYPRAFHWALSLQNKADQFKLFYFANWSPNDPNAFGYGRTLLTGSPAQLTPKGQTLTTLANLVSASTTTRSYDDFSTSPSLTPQLDESLSTANGFELDGKRIVLAIDLKRNTSVGSTVAVTFNNVPTVVGVNRVDLYGHRDVLQWTRGPGNSVQVQVPVADTDPTVSALNQKEGQTVFYVELQK